MPALNITKTAVEALPFTASGQVIYRDTKLRGFGLRVGVRSKTYIAEGSVKGRTCRTDVGCARLMSPEIARNEAREKLILMSRGIDPNKEKQKFAIAALSVREAAKAYLIAKPDLSPVTVQNYSRTFTLYLRGYADLPLRDITRDMVLREHRRISTEHGGVAANNVMRHLRLVYNFAAMLHDGMPPNPVAVITKARAWAPERRRRTLISIHQMLAWGGAVMAEADHARDFLLIAILTGMRRKEIATLRWDYIDLVGMRLHIPKTKNGDPLILPLSQPLAALLSARRGMVGQSEWVFPGTGRTGHLVEVKSFVCRVVQRSGVSFSLHDLRRTFITIAESLDLSPHVLKALLNHRVEADVTGGYIVLNEERLRAPVERIAARVMELLVVDNRVKE